MVIDRSICQPAVDKVIARVPDHKLILEADSRRFHGNMIARADDATRQLVLEKMGLRVIRTTWHEATTHPAVVQRRVAQALSAQR